MASQSSALTASFVLFTFSVRSVVSLRGTFGRGNSMLSSRPFAQIDQLASLAAKRAIGVAGILGFFLTRWALHPEGISGGNFKIPPRLSYSDDLPNQIV